MTRSERLRLPARIVPALMTIAPVILVAAAYVAAVQPRIGEAAQARARARVLQARLTELETTARAAPPGPVAATADGARREFERRTPAEDPSPGVLQALARLAAGAPGGAVREVSVESGRQRIVAAQGGAGGSGVRGETPDPRLALFGEPVALTPVTMTFDASYAAAGWFFWNLRDLPATVEVRRVEIVPAGEASPRLRVTLTLFAFQRVNRDTHETANRSGRGPDPRS